MPSHETIRLELSPQKFYTLCKLIEATKIDKQLSQEVVDKVTHSAEQMTQWVRDLARVNNALLSEARMTSRRRNPFEGGSEDKDPFEDLRHSIDDANFLRVIFDITGAFEYTFRAMKGVVSDLMTPDEVTLFGKEVREVNGLESLQMLQLQTDMNRGTIGRFVDAVFKAEQAQNLVITLGKKIVDLLSHYTDRLQHRHSNEGIKIHFDAVTTDLALSIYENVDATGELKSGKSPDEISAYSIRKAQIVADSLKLGLVSEFVSDAAKLTAWIRTNLSNLWSLAKLLSEGAKPLIDKVRSLMPRNFPKHQPMPDGEFSEALEFINDLNPQNITYKEPKGLMTSEEKFNLDFQNATILMVASYLKDDTKSARDVINIVLDRKHELHEYFANENSFFVCKVGNGNHFTGEAPGMLTVIPGVKPTVNIDNVVGSGFDQIKEFIAQIEQSAKWHDLFLATSPSGSADKSNCLLVGPQGCGKSEVLRAVGSGYRGIGIYAQPSDFLTCWKGEAEKNPKRLFEAAIKLQRETKRQVFILIDEVDTILNDDHARGGFGATNLTTEFQQLMDGIVQYPHLAVWAATNHPERIPMPMIRRFNKVAIVGELNATDRIKLLQHFLGFLPISEKFTSEDWQNFSEKLQGAVGDIIRKVADEVWRSKMTTFVRKHPDQAEMLVKMLNAGSRFQLSAFKTDDRDKLRTCLAAYVQVEPKDVAESLDFHLSNVAIQAEISTAVQTYDRSRKFLAGIRKNNQVDQE